MFSGFNTTDDYDGDDDDDDYDEYNEIEKKERKKTNERTNGKCKSSNVHRNHYNRVRNVARTFYCNIYNFYSYNTVYVIKCKFYFFF